MQPVKPKKSFGQHFLNDNNIATSIVDSLKKTNEYKSIVEIGPGTGVLSDIIFEKHNHELFLIDTDRDSIEFLEKKFNSPRVHIIRQNVLKINLKDNFDEAIGVIGNMPYNISGPLLFMALEQIDMISEWVGMLQKEVANRVVARPSTKDYGILSVLLQAYFDCELLINVPPHVFIPPPKVNSAVIRLVPKKEDIPTCNYADFKLLVKTAFNQRRKTMRNSLKTLLSPEILQDEYFKKRPEELRWQEFVEIVNNCL